MYIDSIFISKYMFLIRNKKLYSKSKKSTFKKYQTKKLRNFRVVLICTCPVIGWKRVIVLCVIFLFGYFYLFFAIVEIKDFFLSFCRWRYHSWTWFFWSYSWCGYDCLKWIQNWYDFFSWENNFKTILNKLYSLTF